MRETDPSITKPHYNESTGNLLHVRVLLSLVYTLPTPKNNGQINIGSTFPNPGTSIGTRQALYTNSSVRGAQYKKKQQLSDKIPSRELYTKNPENCKCGLKNLFTLYAKNIFNGSKATQSLTSVRLTVSVPGVKCWDFIYKCKSPSWMEGGQGVYARAHDGILVYVRKHKSVMCEKQLKTYVM